MGYQIFCSTASNQVGESTFDDLIAWLCVIVILV